jgi:Flp pilus assembly protein TadG
MRVIGGLRKRFAASTRGLAAIEFAMILPVLVLMFLGSVDAGRAIAIYMKVRAATYTLDAITNQYTTIQSTDMSSIVGATSVVLAPYSSSPAVVTISQISVNSSTNATVSWSYSLNGTALTQGATVTVPSSFASCNTYPCFLIYGQVSYTYTPMFGYVFPAKIGLSDSLYVTPRSSTCVLYPPQSITTCASASGSSGSGGSGSGGSGSGGSGSGGSGSGGSGSGGSGSGGSGSGGSGSGGSGGGGGSSWFCILFGIFC